LAPSVARLLLRRLHEELITASLETRPQRIRIRTASGDLAAKLRQRFLGAAARRHRDDFTVREPLAAASVHRRIQNAVDPPSARGGCGKEYEHRDASHTTVHRSSHVQLTGMTTQQTQKPRTWCVRSCS